MEQLLAFYHAYKEKLAAYRLAQDTLYFDVSTSAPKAGITYRNKMLSILAGEAFAYQMHEEHIQKLEQLYEMAEEGSILKKELALYFRLIADYKTLPKEEYVKFYELVSESENVWHEAVKRNDYAYFYPTLKKVIAYQKKMLTYIKKDCSDYDYLLDRYEQGMNIEKYDVLFQKIKEELLPFIQKVQKEGRKIDDRIMFQSFSLDEQEAFMEEVMKALEVNQEKCMITTSQHPFTMFFSANEARITTNYNEHHVFSAIGSTIHEYGHALYHLQMNPAYHGTALTDAVGCGMHESQSRLFENHIGRSEAFWYGLYPKMQAYFPKQLQDVSFEQFMLMINVSYPSFIRTDADELTYPIHLLIRYELEKDIFSGKLALEDLKQVWNDKYEEYLGIRPTTDNEGILQDIHWSSSSFGYFPTYVLGSAYAAQFWHAMEKDIQASEQLKKGNIRIVKEWLKEHVHQYAAEKTADEILMLATKEAFQPDYYITYLKEKFSKVYDL